jgi:hypothetical protein
VQGMQLVTEVLAFAVTQYINIQYSPPGTPFSPLYLCYIYSMQEWSEAVAIYPLLH